MGHGLLPAIPGESLLGQWLSRQQIARLTPCFPALTCPMQATLTSGAAPSVHGIIANGLAIFRSEQDQELIDSSNFGQYRREISFWEQSNQLVEARRFWQRKDGSSRHKTALLFFQNSLPGFVEPLKPAADIVLSPKPEHGPDGKLTSLCWSAPAQLIGELTERLGPFPLMNYWGPMANITSSKWIANAAAWVWQQHRPDLQLVYIPHLDYDQQRFGPESEQARQAVRDVSEAIEPLLKVVLEEGAKLVVLSEYAIATVSAAVYPNRILAQAGLLMTRMTADGAIPDYAHSDAFALVDHQIAHVYVKNADAMEKARELFQGEPGIGAVFAGAELAKLACAHRRGGDLVLEASAQHWFAYPWWSDDAEAPLFAGTVDIHCKPGYDPLELFWDRAANRIRFDTSLIRGSHGIPHHGEAILAGDLDLEGRDTVRAEEVAGLCRAALEGG